MPVSSVVSLKMLFPTSRVGIAGDLKIQMGNITLQEESIPGFAVSSLPDDHFEERDEFMSGLIINITFPHTVRWVTKGVGAKRDGVNSPSEDIMVMVSETAADVLETSVEELPPLSDAIDPDALCAIASSRTNALPPRVTVAFDYAGLEIFVSSDNMVFAQPISSTEWVGQQGSYQ